MPSDRTARYVTSGTASGLAEPSGLSGLSGPSVLLVHGIGVSGRYYASLAEHLGSTHRVVIPDLPGFGDSGRPRPALSITEQAVALEAVVESSGLVRPVLVGHSMGAQVATELAVRNPGLARAVILIGPVVDPAASSAFQQGWRLALDILGEPLRLNATVLWDYLRGGPRSFFGTLRHMLDYPLEERLGQVDVPVVLMRGSHDPIASSVFLQRLARAVGGAEVVEVPEAGHIAMAVRPELVAEVCRRFV